MASMAVYKVIYHFEDNTTSKPRSPYLQDFVTAAASDESSLRAVLTSNGKTLTGATAKFLSIHNQLTNVLS